MSWENFKEHVKNEKDYLKHLVDMECFNTATFKMVEVKILCWALEEINKYREQENKYG